MCSETGNLLNACANLCNNWRAKRADLVVSIGDFLYMYVSWHCTYRNVILRGIRKRHFPEPNPQRVELPRNATVCDVFNKAKQLYFSEMETNIESMCLADSGGILIPIDDKDSWLLSSFYQKNHLQPSRYKLYVAVKEEVSLSAFWQLERAFFVMSTGILLCIYVLLYVTRTVMLYVSSNFVCTLTFFIVTTKWTRSRSLPKMCCIHLHVVYIFIPLWYVYIGIEKL